MSIIGPLQPADKVSTETADIEGKIRELLHKDASRNSADNDGESAARITSNTIQRVVGTSLAQIDRLIGDLTELRDHLKNQGEHVQSEIARVDSEIASYARASQTAAQSIGAMDQSLARFKLARGESRPLAQPETEKI